MENVFREVPSRRRRPVDLIVPLISIAVLLAGVGVAVWKFWPSLDQKANIAPAVSQRPAVAPTKPQKTVPLSKEARHVAGRFILTNVRRQNLAEGYTLVGAPLRQGFTLKQWLTGDIPVIPFNGPIGLAPMKIDYSYKGSALVEVALLPPKGSKVKPETFWMELKRIGTGANARWVVWSWAPRAAPPIPANPVG